jgi:hypothetical protein
METTLNLNGINYYSIENPIIGNHSIANFNVNNDAFFGILTQFKGYTCILNHNDVTKKKKIVCWSKYVPLHKNLVVQVDEIDTLNKVALVSMAYLGDDIKEKLTNGQLQEILMIPFNENKILENFIKSICIIHNYDMKHIWTTLIHHVDSLRIDEESDSSLWKYFSDNIDDIDDWVEEVGLEQSVADNIKLLFGKRTDEGIKKITSRIGIISVGGINGTKTLLSNIVSKFDFKYNLRFDAAPYYLFETHNDDTDVETHTDFYKCLEKEASKFNPKIFVKADFCGKLSID